MATQTRPQAPAFQRQDELFVPQGPARSGWDASLANGSVVAGLLAALLEDVLRQPGFQVARITVDLLKPVPFAPLRGQAQVLREGGRLRQGHAQLSCAGQVVARASGLFLAPSAGPTCVHGAAPLVFPEGAEKVGMFRDEKDAVSDPSYQHFCDLRWVSARDAAQPALWITPPTTFIEGEPCSDLVRCVAAADLLAGLAELARRSHTPESPVAINADLNLVFAGEPRGAAFGLRLTQLTAAAGVGFAHAELFDQAGFRGLVTQTRVGNTPRRVSPAAP